MFPFSLNIITFNISHFAEHQLLIIYTSTSKCRSEHHPLLLFFKNNNKGWLEGHTQVINDD